MRVCDRDCAQFLFFSGVPACQRNGPEDVSPGESIYPTRLGDRCIGEDVSIDAIDVAIEPQFKPGDMIRATLKYDVLNIYEGYIVGSDGDMWLAEVVNTSIKSEAEPRPTVLRFTASTLESIDEMTSDRAKQAFELSKNDNSKEPTPKEVVVVHTVSTAKRQQKKVAPEEMMISLF